MKKLLVATTVAMALSATAHAADSTAQLKVQGVLTNDACTPTLSGGGTIDFGTYFVDSLSSTDVNQLGHKDTTLSIACSSPTKVAWSVEDNVGDAVDIDIINSGFSGGTVYGGGVAVDAHFGVGKTAGGVAIGSYAIAIDKHNATADGVTKSVTYTITDGETWTQFFKSGTYDYVRVNPYQYSVGDGTDGDVPIAFTNAVFPMRIALAVEKTSTLAITDDTPISGQATITLHYL
jgi:opacity protein-like surface antigen